MAWSTDNTNDITVDEFWARVQEVQAKAVDQDPRTPTLSKGQVESWFHLFTCGLVVADDLEMEGDELQVSMRSGQPVKLGDIPGPAVFVEGSCRDVSVWVGTTPDPRIFGPETTVVKARIYCGGDKVLKGEGAWLDIQGE